MTHDTIELSNLFHLSLFLFPLDRVYKLRSKPTNRKPTKARTNVPTQIFEETFNCSSSHKVFHIHEAHSGSNKKDHGSSNKEAHKSNKAIHTGTHEEAYIGSHGSSNKDAEAHIGSHSSFNKDAKAHI